MNSLEVDKCVAMAFMDFLQTKKAVLKHDPEKVESLEVASQCLGEIFELDSKDAVQRAKYSLDPATLQDIVQVYLKKKSNMDTAQETSTSQVDSVEAERFKKKGNDELTKKNYELAIEYYTKAISYNPQNAVYYCNRAAAYSYVGKDSLAAEDCRQAIALDSSYVKAYTRLGLAEINLGNSREAVEAYEKALQLDPLNESLRSSLSQAKSKLESVKDNGEGMSGLGGLDFANMMKNPQIMKMAQEMAKNGGLSELLKNPNVAQMAQNMLGKDPESLAKMAQAFSGTSPNAASN